MKVLDGVVNGSLEATERGIYYLDRDSMDSGSRWFEATGAITRLRYFDFATGASTTVAPNIGNAAYGISASRDGRTVFFSRVDQSTDELMLVEGFR